MNNGIQIDFDFSEPKNHFKDRLDEGKFFILFEIDTPSKKRDFTTAANHVRSIANAASKINGIETGIALTDKTESIDSWNAADFATEALSDNKKDHHLIYISGKKSSRNDILDMMGRCASAGFQNVVPVTGNGYPDEIANIKNKQACYDSANILHMIKNMDDRNALYPGCVVNPFKYTPSNLFPQYFKLIKKLNFGARFIVSQIGWDMMKLQELRWYLDARDFHFPTVARLQMLTPEITEDILNGSRPGIHISRDFKFILEKENQFGYKQFASAQWRRLQLQATGCRLLGYSGIQIAGIERPEHLGTVCSKIKDAMLEFSNFDTWKVAYLDHLARSDMAPFSHRFYHFKNLFSTANPIKPEVNPEGTIPCHGWDKFHYKICKSMFSQDHLLSPEEHRLTKKIFVGCSACSYCRLPLTHYICPETCPKGLANGSCGGTKPNGNCELRTKQCVHARRTERAAWLNEIDILEERYIKHPEVGGKVKNPLEGKN